MDLDRVFANGRFVALFRLMLRNNLVTKQIVRYMEKRAYEALVVNTKDRPFKARQDRYDLLVALLNGFVRVHAKGQISKGVTDRIVDSFVSNIVLAPYDETNKGKAVDAPFTLAISPTQKCNLKCIGCYAASDSKCDATLEFDVFDRMLTEKVDLWGSHFTVISGGEPFLYESGGKGFLDAVERHLDQTFMVYTNGMLFTRDVTKRMADLGNVYPAISVEGFEAETDARRGKGVYAKIMKAMEDLREAGVPFGVSATATRNNWEVVTSEKFVRHFFLDQNVIFMWIFQYMPIGRAHTLDLMVTPDQRKKMLERTWQYVRRDGYFLADFWNSGTAGFGCISAARPGGYLYVNWHGDIMPCVFAPFSTDNIYNIYKSGGNLNTVLTSPFFKFIQQWQEKYGYDPHVHQPDNWLAPCIIRDHFKAFLAAASKAGARPADADAAAAVGDPAYIDGLAAYGKEFYRITQADWQKDYIADRVPAGDLASAGD